ncbi:zinc ribbon domain-containing protein [Virgibacillus sp. FSP13]
MRYCKHCGGELADHAKFCKHCGQDLTSGGKLDEEKPVNNSGDHVDKENSEEIQADDMGPNDEKTSKQEDQPIPENKQTGNENQGGLSQKPVPPKQPKQPLQGGLVASKKTRESQPAKKLSKQAKISMAIAGALIVLLFVAYQVGASMTSKEKVIERFEDAITQKDASTVAGLLEADGKIAINKETVKGFIDYYGENPSEFAYMMDHLQNQVKQYDKNPNLAKANDGGYDYAVNLIENGKKYLVYDKYSIQVSPVYFEVYTNYKDTDILLNDEVIVTSDTDEFTQEVGPFLPGTYTFTATYKNDFVELTAEADSTNFDPGFSDHVDLGIEGEEVTFRKPFGEELDNVKLYINGEDTGINIMEQDTFGPLLTDGSITASFEGEFPWGTMKTEEVPIDSYYVEADFTVNDDVRQAMKDTIIKFNQEFLAAATTADKKKLTVASEDLVKDIIDDAKNAKENEKYYKGKFVGVDFNSDSFEITNYGDGWTVEVETATIYEQDTWYGEDEKPKLEEVSEQYGYELIYDKDNEQWKVDKIGWAASIDSDKKVEYREKQPKVFTSAWLK